MSNNEIMPRTGRISQKCGENSPSFCAGGQGSGLRGGQHVGEKEERDGSLDVEARRRGQN